MTIERPMFPPRAELVDSFSHQRTPRDRPDETSPGASPRPAEGIGRRSLLVALVALPAAAPTAAHVSSDPVHAMIEQHKVLSAAYTAAVNHPGVGAVGSEQSEEAEEAEEISDGAYDALLDRAERLFAFRPPTLAGVAALLRYASVLEEWELPRGFNDNPEMQNFCATMTGAIEAIVRRGDAA
jgi:hypothetical protein